MYFKTILVICAQTFLLQNISGQCYEAPFAAAPFAAAPLPVAPCAAAWSEARYAAAPLAGWAYGPAGALAASNGPGLAVSSASPLLPAGVSVLSENAYEGVLATGGAVPFLGTVALEGAVPTAGAGAISYGCGNGAINIYTEDLAAVGLASPGFAGLAEPFGLAGLSEPYGYGPALAGYGYSGCGAIY